MPRISKLNLFCRTCGTPVHMPTLPADDVTCGGCGASLGTVAELGLIRPSPQLGLLVARHIRAFIGC